MPQDESPYMGWLGREAPGITPRTGALSNNPKDAIGRTKVPMHLIPSTALVEMARVFGYGAFTKGYGPYNWRDSTIAATVYFSAAQRHMAAALDGEWIDPESGLPHVALAAANMAILIDAFATGNVVDDRPKAGPTAAMLRGEQKQPVRAMPPAMVEVTPQELEAIRNAPDNGRGIIEANIHRAAQGQPVEGVLSPMEQELFCMKVKEQNGGKHFDPPPAKAEQAPRDFLWYVATPYTASPLGVCKASELADDALRELLRRGVRAFCPIAHGHVAGASLPQDHEFWMAVDRPFMDRCDGLLVLRHPGWKESKGVTEEVKTFSRAGKPVVFFDDPNVEYAKIKESQVKDWDAMVRSLRMVEAKPSDYIGGAA